MNQGERILRTDEGIHKQEMETKHRLSTDDDGVEHCCFKFWFALPKITSKRVCQGIHNMTRAVVRKDKMKIKGTTGNAQRKRKNEKKKKRQGSPRGTTMLITWVSTGRTHHDDDGHTQASIALTWVIKMKSLS